MTKETSREPPMAIHTDREHEFEKQYNRRDSLDMRLNTQPMNFSERDQNAREQVEINRKKE